MKHDTPVDRRALKTLFDTFWSSAGWRAADSKCTPRDDFEYAKRAGLMFHPIELSHDDIEQRAIEAVGRVDHRNVVNAFIASLSSRRLDLRSALGSFAVLQHFPRHVKASQDKLCHTCGLKNHYANEDLNVLNFERFKWGGVRHLQPLYASFDLQLFQQITPSAPLPSDVKILRSIVRAIDVAPKETTSATLEKQLGKLFKSNKAEREILIGILGYCGVVATEAHPGFRNHFVEWTGRVLPSRRFVDMAYPACWWQRADGINDEALGYWFGHAL